MEVTRRCLEKSRSRRRSTLPHGRRHCRKLDDLQRGPPTGRRRMGRGVQSDAPGCIDWKPRDGLGRGRDHRPDATELAGEFRSLQATLRIVGGGVGLLLAVVAFVAANAVLGMPLFAITGRTCPPRRPCCSARCLLSSTCRRYSSGGRGSTSHDARAVSGHASPGSPGLEGNPRGRPDRWPWFRARLA